MTVTKSPTAADEPVAEAPAEPPRRDLKPLLFKVFLAIVGAVVLYFLPLQFPRAQVTLINTAMCIALAALGLNLLTGYNGQISIGHGAFMGIGAYTTAILVQTYDYPHFGALVLSALATFVVGLVIGLPALRIRGVYLALVTLALATVFPQFVVRFTDVTGGTTGMEVDNEFKTPISGITNSQWRYYVILIFVVIAFILVRNIVRSRVGRSLIAMRDNETAAEVVGIHLAVFKVATFGLSAMLAGIGGSLLVFNTSHVDPIEFGLGRSVTILVAVVIGGAATVFGPAIGAVLVVFLPEWLEAAGLPQILTPALFGSLLILLMAVAPTGLIGLARSAWRLVTPGPKATSAPPFSAPADSQATVAP
jgi:branched-chain amino acid transport system permease protein